MIRTKKYDKIALVFWTLSISVVVLFALHLSEFPFASMCGSALAGDGGDCRPFIIVTSLTEPTTFCWLVPLVVALVLGTAVLKETIAHGAKFALVLWTLVVSGVVLFAIHPRLASGCLASFLASFSPESDAPSCRAFWGEGAVSESASFWLAPMTFWLVPLVVALIVLSAAAALKETRT